MPKESTSYMILRKNLPEDEITLVHFMYMFTTSAMPA